ncbi:MAG TPA: DUF4350 domain-containing protein, partial [Chthoniobacterales bacterium]|nr:DUF4350 domain-containing protein [Chthoniobacterales bacterium]
MSPRRFNAAAAWFVLIGCLFALLFYGYQTLQIRVETGDSLPEFSTYRADPKGLKAFYESVRETDNITVSRRLQPSRVLPSGENRVLIFAGVSPYGMLVSEEDSELLDHWLATGGRLIIAFRPEKILESATENPESGSHPQKDTTFTNPWGDLIRRWGAHLTSIKAAQPGTAESTLFPAASRWFGQNVFDKLTPEWKSIAVQGGKNVIVERTVGPGSIALLSDTYPLSNEALAADRQTDFLIWLINDRAGVVFDEIHLGLAEHPGIMTLAHRYGLQGTLISIVAVLLLFIWRCQYSLLPRRKSDMREYAVSGSSSEQTFLNLLQRSIPEK